MTEEQVQELKDLDLPCCPSLFQFCEGNFAKYKGQAKLLAFRSFGFDGSEMLEQRMGSNWLKMAKWKKERRHDLR